MLRVRCLLPLAVFAALLGFAAPSHAQTVIDEWPSIKTPPAPELKPVTVDPKTTALLVLDFLNQNCGHRPRCLATIPAMKKLLAEARAKGVTVIYTFWSTVTDVIKDVAPVDKEPTVVSQLPDKFLNSDLDKILKDHGITTVIVNGTSAQGAVLYTGSKAALHGYKVIVPVDGMSSDDAYPEQFTAWLMANGPGFGARVTLTRIDMIKF